MNATKTLFLGVFVFSIVFSFFAAASMIIPANDNAKENGVAPANSPAIGAAWDLERVDFIHYAKHYARPSGGGSGGATSCFKLMGVKWNALPVSYVVNPSNPQNLSQSFIENAVSASAETWDAATSKELFVNSFAIDYSAQYGVQNYQNAIAFGSHSDAGVIAVTSVWFTRAGKQIVEFDLLFNTNYAWGNASLDSSKMDLQNVATHELGHAVGLSDIYSSSCSQVTMYGYGSAGDTSKQTLESPDIAGLQKMYGA